MVGTDQPCQIESLRWCIKCNGTVLRIFRYGLGRDMLMSFQDQVGPDFIGNNIDIISTVDFHCLLYFPALPDTSTWVMWGTENSCMNVVFSDFFLHIFKIHTPDSILIQDEWTVYNMITGVCNASCKSNVSRRVQ